MDYFENLVKTLLEEEFLWVAQSIKVEITKEEKRRLQKPSLPRPEIDLVVFDFAKDRLIAVEVKSYFDSPGVDFRQIKKVHDVTEGGYKLFTTPTYREIVFSRLKSQLLEKNLIQPTTSISLGLVAGKVQKTHIDGIEDYFDARGWFYWSPEEVKSRVRLLSDKAYDNNPYVITAKAMLR